MHPYQTIKSRQLAVVRKTRALERKPATDDKPRRVLLMTRLGLIQGLALWIGLGFSTGDFGGSTALVLPAALMGGLLLDALRSV